MEYRRVAMATTGQEVPTSTPEGAEYPGPSAARAAFGQPGEYGGEWLPSNAGSFAPAAPTSQAPSTSGAPAAAPKASSTSRAATLSGGRRGLLLGAIAATLVAGVGGGAAGSLATLYALRGRSALGLPATVPVTASSAAQGSTGAALSAGSVAGAQASATLDLPSLYRQVAPAVVAIRVSSTRGGGGEGSGFVVDERGHVITNNHVVQGASRVTLRLLDGSTLGANVVATDPDNDLALLRASGDARSLPAVRLGDSDTVQPGDAAIAMGSPFGFEHSITSGIVSAVDREFGATRRRAAIAGLIQTDAAVNPGNSGGPLFNARGEVVGVNTMGASPVSGSVGVSFAVPINAAKRLLTRAAAQ